MAWRDLSDRVLKSAMRPFREDAVWTPKGGAPTAISGPFDLSPLEVNPDTGVGVRSSTPVLHVRLSEIASRPRQGERLEVRGVAYRIADVEPDGQGAAALRLHRE